VDFRLVTEAEFAADIGGKDAVMAPGAASVARKVCPACSRSSPSKNETQDGRTAKKVTGLGVP